MSSNDEQIQGLTAGQNVFKLHFFVAKINKKPVMHFWHFCQFYDQKCKKFFKTKIK
jgi:hypothetical protein